MHLTFLVYLLFVHSFPLPLSSFPYTAVGDSVQADDVIAVIETDKVTVEVRAPNAGVITKHIASPQQAVKVGAPLLVIDPNGKNGKTANVLFLS